MNKPIAIVVLNWNGIQLLEQFLPQLVNHSKEAAIYVADNASTDASIAFIKANFSTITILANKKNEGFAKGYNSAIKQINEPLLCLLNNDVEVTQNWLQPILEIFNSDPKTAIVQPKILNYNQKEKFEYAGAAGGFIDKYGYPFCRGRIFSTIEKDQQQYNTPSTIFWASGACFFIRNKTFKDLQGFDESFFAHMEEIDLCWRAFNKGLTTTYCPTSVVYHVGGATLKNTNAKKTYLNFRNSLFTLLKNAPKPLFKKLFIRLLLDGIAGLHFVLQLQFKHCFAIIAAHFSFYLNAAKMYSKRTEKSPKKNYYLVKSIVWEYFIHQKKKYSELK